MCVGYTHVDGKSIQHVTPKVVKRNRNCYNSHLMPTYQQLDWQQITVTALDGTTPTPGLTVSAAVTSHLIGGGTLTDPFTNSFEDNGDGTYTANLEPFEVTGVERIEITFTTGGAATIAPEDITLVDPSTLSTETQYHTVEDLYSRFGSENINKWADMNNLRKPREIATRIIDAIVTASNYVESRLRQRYNSLPFDPIPWDIRNLTRLRTGYVLYGARGIEDENDEVSSANTEFRKTLQEILRGQLRIDAPTVKTHGSPFDQSETNTDIEILL